MGEEEAWEARWQALAAEAFREVTAWRSQHPRATLREIEAAMDERPACPRCGGRVRPRGQHRRQLTTAHEQPVVLERRYAECPACGAGLFPLDEELALLPGCLTPWLHERLVQVGTRQPVAVAAGDLAARHHVRVSAATARRTTARAGARWCRWSAGAGPRSRRW